MTVGVLRLAVRLPDSHSLKEKRWQVKSLVAQIRNRFNVSIAEIDTQDKWQLATFGAAHIGNDRARTNQMLDQVLGFVERVKQIEVVDSQIEIF